MKQIYYFLFICLFISSCAQYGSVSGGERDKTNPKLKKSVPLNKTTSFKGREITLQFDEWVDAQQLQQELIITPAIEGSYTYKAKNNVVSIQFDKPFLENTTYTFNFKNGIKDLTERNATENLKLTFSTGTIIDSLSVQGEVRSLFTQSVVSKATIGLYPYSNTLDITKQKPLYFIQSDSVGKFVFENVKANTYQVVAFDDVNKNLLFTPKNEHVGFIEKPIDLKKNENNLFINIYKADEVAPKRTKLQIKADEFILNYDENLKNVQVQFQKDSTPYIYKNNSLSFFINSLSNDTLKVKLTISDSLDNQLISEEKIYFKTPDKKKKNMPLNAVFKHNATDKVSDVYIANIVFEKPILLIDTSKILIVADTITKHHIKKGEYNYISKTGLFTINKPIKFEKEIEFRAKKGAFINIQGDSSQKMTYKAIKQSVENFGSIEGKTNKKYKGYIIQLVSEENKVVVESYDTTFKFEFIPEGNYYLRLIQDSNQNKRWDFGNPKKFINPESIERSELLRIKANFEIKDITIP